MKTRVAIIVAALFCAFLWSAGARAEEPIIIEVVVRGEAPQHAEQIKRIVPLRKGEPLTLIDIARTISLLKKTGLYRNIRVDEEQLPDGVRVLIDLEPQRFVRRVRFKGVFPMFESELRNAVTIREGNVYKQEEIDKNVKRLEVFLQEEGFFESEVGADVELDRKTGDVIITFRLSKGFTYSLKKVVTEGNNFLSNSRIKLIIRRKMPFRYRKEKLDEGLQAVVEAYHRKGFYEAGVKLESIELDPGLSVVTVHLLIHEGPRVMVKIRGNRNILDERIKRELTFATEQSVDEYEMNACARKIEALYKSRGYLFATVGRQVNELTDRKGNSYTEIVFIVNEGPKVKVKEVKFRGSNIFESKKLRKQMIVSRRRAFGRAPLLAEEVLEDDLTAIETFYRNWGFEEVRVGTPEINLLNRKGTKAEIVVPIHEGPQTVVRDVVFKGVEFFEAERILAELTLVSGTPYDPTRLSTDKRKLVLLYADWGFPYAKISQKVRRSDEEGLLRNVVINYEVREGIRVEVGEVVIRGNYRTKGRVLSREIEIRPGEPFSYSALLTSRRNLRTLAFLYSARLETLGLEERMEVLHLLLAVRERPVRTVDLGVGYDSDLGPNAQVELADLNLFGYGKVGKLKLMGGGDITRVEVLYTDLRFMGSRILADSGLMWSYERRESFDLTQVEGRFSLTKKLTTYLTGTLAARTSWNLLGNVDADEVEDITDEENVLMGLGPSIVHDTRDDFIDPSDGWFNRVKVEYVQEFTWGDEFVKIEGQASHFATLMGSVVLATSLNVGHIEPLGDSDVPLQEVYFVGGNRSVRGYSEDGLGPHNAEGEPLGGLDKIVTNFELRFPVWRFVRGVVFCDSGQLAADFSQLKFIEQMFTVGAGVRLLTPVGPVRLDWGYKLEPVSWERRYRWHFSFGYPF